MAFSLGGSKSDSKGTSSTSQNIWDPQAQGLDQLYNSTGNLLNSQQANNNASQQLVPGAERNMQQAQNLGMGGMQNQMGGGSWGDTSAVRDQMLNQMQGGQTNTGMMYQNIVGGPGNTYIDPMVAAMKTGMMQNRDAMQSGNAMGANAMGQGGSNRHAMQNAMTDKQVNQDMTQAEMDMRGNNYAQDMDWKMNIARLADANQQSNLDRMYNMVDSGNQSQQFGMNYAPTQQNLGMGQFAPQAMANQVPWYNQQNAANIFGDPQVLTQNEQKTKGSSMGGSFSL